MQPLEAPSGRVVLCRGFPTMWLLSVTSLILSLPVLRRLQANRFGRDAMMEDYQSTMKNDVWDIVPRLEGKSVVTSKWIYKIKHTADGSIEKYKARFVARGFSQKEGVDYMETFALVSMYTSIRVVISLASVMGWKIHQIDVKTTFLNGVIEEEVYIEQPQGFEVFFEFLDSGEVFLNHFSFLHPCILQLSSKIHLPVYVLSFI
jgi:hypothetical protein